MNALQRIASASRKLGYQPDAIKYDYGFPDFAATVATIQDAELAVFTQTPASYRSAAFGVAHGDSATAQMVASSHRSLGAPLFFVIESSGVSVWQVLGTGPARFLERAKLDEIGALFESHQANWAPDAIHRAKSIGKFDKTYQLDFVDAGLLPSIEGQIHQKLDRLLTDVLASIQRRKAKHLDERCVFQAVFRLLAAKILIDRQHPIANQWDVDNVGAVLHSIGAYYNLPGEAKFASNMGTRQIGDAWSTLRAGLNVANISADDLAYVYETTLVTPETRATFGTHSTPRQVGEFIAARLGLWRPEARSLRVYEPFSGAGVLLVAALRHMRESLPSDWSDRKRHDHLVKQLRGSEIDTFACEVATLSLILADYPNTNGWKINNADLFEEGVLTAELSAADVILCNPPFEPFTDQERARYPMVGGVGGNKAEAVLKLAIQAKPSALGFVLPRAFVMDRAYGWHRSELERRFSEIEIVSLPDGIFRESTVESALLIARQPADVGTLQRVRSSDVDDQDRKSFLSIGVPSRYREELRTLTDEPTGKLWLTPLISIWRRTERLPTLGQQLDAHWGIRWLDGRQGTAANDRPAVGRARGISTAKDHRQFALGRTYWLDVEPSHLYGGGDLPWSLPKILCNASRSSRGKWRISAAVDRDGLVASQQFVALWPKHEGVDLDALAAIINGPLANAFMTEHSADKRLRIGTLLSLPVPEGLPDAVGDNAREYARVLADGQSVLGGEEVLQHLIDEIDAAVLDAYDLPPRMIRSLLAEFRGLTRPLVHNWQDWDVSASDPALTLSELRSEWVRLSRSNWPAKELPPVASKEAALVSEMMGLRS